MSFVGGKLGNKLLKPTSLWNLFSPHAFEIRFVLYFLYSIFCRELSNGSIFHKRHKTLFYREDYEIYHFQVGTTEGQSFSGFDRVYKVCSTESLINVSIIQGAKIKCSIYIWHFSRARVRNSNSGEIPIPTHNHTFSGAIGSTLLYASVICLSIHIFIFTAIKKLRKPPAQNLLALTCALCPGQLLLVLALSNNTSHSICIATATFLHYFFLVAAFWMNVLHFDLCRVCFKRHSDTNSKFLFYKLGLKNSNFDLKITSF